MDFGDLVGRRRMVRAYLPDPVPDELLQCVLDRARRAPSAANAQPVRFVVVRSAGGRAALATVCGEEDAVARGLPRWLSTAPVLVVPCVDVRAYAERYEAVDKTGVAAHERAVPWHWVDGGQALMLLLLAAVDEGLGAGLLDVQDRAGLHELLSIPAEVEPLGVVSLGYPVTGERPVGSARRIGRLPLRDVVHDERWAGG